MSGLIARLEMARAAARVGAPRERALAETFSIAKRHPGQIVAGLAISVALIKLAVISGFSVTTMLAVANAVSPTSFLFGVLFAPPYPLFLGIITCLWVWVLLNPQRTSRFYVAWIASFLIVISFATRVDWWLYLSLSALGSILATIQLLDSFLGKSLMTHFVGLSVALIVAGVALTEETPWIPKELSILGEC